MKLTEFKKLIREEIQKVLNEDDFSTRASILNKLAGAREAARPYDTLALVSKYLDTKYPGIKYTKTDPDRAGGLVNIQIKMKPYIVTIQMTLDGKWHCFTTGPGPDLNLSKMTSKDPNESFKKIKPWLDTTIKNMKAES